MAKPSNHADPLLSGQQGGRQSQGRTEIRAPEGGTMDWNRLIQGDCIEGLGLLEPASVDLVFADPPFNIGYDYDVYRDRKEYEHYLDWSRDWIGAVHRVLKPDGTFWLAIGDEYAAELKIESQKL